MQIDTQEISLYLQAIKNSYESGDHSKTDCQVLAALYLQGGLYRRLMEFPALVDSAAKIAIAKFTKLVREAVEAPVISPDTDLSYGLQRRRQFNGNDALPSEFCESADQAFKEFMAEFLGGIQADILALAVKAKSGSGAAPGDADYVIGMAEVTAQNFGALVAPASETEGRNYAEIDRFFSDGCRFVSSVRVELSN